MPECSNSKYTEVVDDMYRTYVEALSDEDDAEFAEFIAEYTAPSDRTLPVCDDVRYPLVRTFRILQRQSLRRAA